jgi:nucleotide-binding universal stress UspA family protein
MNHLEEHTEHQFHHHHNHHHDGSHENKNCCGDCKGNGACKALKKLEQFNISPIKKINTMKTFQKILVPYDFSEFAEQALRFATLLSSSNTAITIVNILEVPYISDPTGLAYAPINQDELVAGNNAEVEKLLADLRLWYPNLTFDSKIILNEDIADAICKTQLEGEHELIVMGSHGRKGLERLLMGSVAELVMRNATCPVLIIKK